MWERKMMDDTIALELTGTTQISERNCLRLRLKIDVSFRRDSEVVEFEPENIAISLGENQFVWECPRCDSLSYYSHSPGLYYLQPRYKCDLSEKSATELMKKNEYLSLDLSRFLKVNGNFLTIAPIQARIEYK